MRSLIDESILELDDRPGTREAAGQIFHTANAYTPLQRVYLRSGICYDERMRAHETIDVRDHHPEDPRRALRIYDALQKAGLVHGIDAVDTDVPNPYVFAKIGAREASQQEICLVHTAEHYAQMLTTASMTYAELERAQATADSMYFNNESAYCAMLSCGGAIETCAAVAAGTVKNAFACIRPPGHHAEPEVAGGFCLFNNVAVAAKATMARYHETVRKIMILDWDVHHGNGTQRAFYNDPNVLYCSLHRYDNGAFYPGTTYGHASCVGEGDGEGYSVNVPWPRGEMHDGDYVYAFQRLIMPIAHEFQPDLVIISAGFDAATGDEIGQCNVSPAGYAQMTHMLMSLASGRLVVVLEGGYNLDSIAMSALYVAKTLLGEPPPPLQTFAPSEEAVQVVDECIACLSPFWTNLHPSMGSKLPGLATAAKPLSQVMADVQAARLISEFEMVPLRVPVDAYTVMATVDFTNTDKLIILTHGPSEAVLTRPNTMNDQIDLQTAYTVDAASMYVAWAIENGYGVVDIRATAQNAETRRLDELLVFLWDTYVAMAEASAIVLFNSAGLAGSFARLVAQRFVFDRVKCIVSVYGNDQVDNMALKVSVGGEKRDFSKRSLVYVSHKTQDRYHGSRQRFGRLLFSPYDTNAEILGRHYKAVTSWMAARV